MGGRAWYGEPKNASRCIELDRRRFRNRPASSPHCCGSRFVPGERSGTWAKRQTRRRQRSRRSRSVAFPSRRRRTSSRIAEKLVGIGTELARGGRRLGGAPARPRYMNEGG